MVTSAFIIAFAAGVGALNGYLYSWAGGLEPPGRRRVAKGGAVIGGALGILGSFAMAAAAHSPRLADGGTTEV